MSNGAPAFTVVCKTTFLLRQGQMELASEQDDPNEEDTYWDDDPRKSLSLATDLVPYKARADVVVVGHSFAPDHKPSRSWAARLFVGPMQKTVEVYCDRAFGLDGELREGPPILRARLRYERAAGGPDTSNPVGMRFDVQDALGATAIPNLQPPGLLVAHRADTFGPIGLGPIAPGWPGRRHKLHGAAVQFGGRGWNAHPMPEGVEPAYFNIAPPDQQLDALHADECVDLECLHPEHSRLTTRLPGIEPSASVERAGQSGRPLPLVCDTLWIDTDRRVCHLVWRGTLVLTHPAETGRIVVRQLAETRLPWPPAAFVGASGDPGSTLLAPLIGAAAIALPFAQAGDAARPPSPRSQVRDGALPFGAPGEPASAPPFAIPEVDASEGTIFLADGALPGQVTAVLPGAAPPPAPPPPPAPGPQPASPPAEAMVAQNEFSAGAPLLPAPPPPATPAAVAAPSVVSAPVAPPLVSAPVALPAPVGSVPAAPALVSAPPAEPPKRRESIGERMAQELAHAEANKQLEKKSSGEPEYLGPLAVGAAAAGGTPAGKGARAEGAGAGGGSAAAAPGADSHAAKRGWKPVSRLKDAPVPTTDVAKGGALAASNAALAPGNERSERAARATDLAPLAPPRDAIELLWLDPSCLPRVRRQPAWKDLLTQVKPKPLDDEPGADAPADRKQEARDRREMAVILSRGDALDMRGIETAMTNAVNEDGIFVPPLVLVAGDLTLPFDEVETLKATIAAVTPLIGGDAKLQAAVDTAQKLLQTSWLAANGGASEIAETLTTKLKEAFAQANRAVPARYLDHHTERMLLHQRAHQKRTILGKACVRGLLTLSGTCDALPIYLPEDAAKELPSLLRLAVKIVAECRSRLEEAEERSVALRAVGLARLARAE